MWTEHLHKWLRDAPREEAPDATKWRKFVEIVQAAFREFTPSENITWQTVVFIQKGDGRNLQGLVSWRYYEITKRASSTNVSH